ncbi:hypothetical protein PUN28_018189 [Cardiocondyla obscurior]
MLEALENLQHIVLTVFARLCTNKESPSEYMSNMFFGNLLYDNYIFTIPIILDLCQLYGRENAKVVEKIIYSVFNLQPMYNDDLQKSVPCLIKALENVERRFENCPSDMAEAVALSDRKSSTDITLHHLEDLVIYILDVASTLSILLKIYSPIIDVFHKDDFINKIVSLYGSTIPEMYKKLDMLACNDENMPKYIELKHRLDVTRVEILNMYRIITYNSILNIQENINTISENEIRNCIDEYFNSLINAISEKEFIIDYHQFYPIDNDLQTVARLYPEIDTIKHTYILQSLYASIGDAKATSVSSNNTNVAVAGCSGVQNNQQKKHFDVNGLNNKTDFASKEPDHMSLISDVKEILCDYGEGFIQECLKHYNYKVQSVINAVLEDDLPDELKEIDKTLPYIPPDVMEKPPVATGSNADNLASNFQEFNISDNNKFEIITQNFASTSNTRKKKDKYRNANEMFNDKSEIKKSWKIYEKYGLVDEYEDEYDDTYDSHDVRGSADDSTEIDARAFVARRVFQTREKNESSSENDTENENEKRVQNNNHFVQNPAELRAKAEQQKQFARNGKSVHHVNGKFKGQRQDSGAIKKKTGNRSSHSNYNQRMGAQMKRNRGMVPS